MPQRTTLTTITALPPHITRAQALSFLHDHLNMIDLNPLVIRRTPVTAPSWAPESEAACTWYSITDSISYLPGSYFTSEVNYTSCFQDLNNGIWTHSYAAMGVEIKGKWTIGGNEEGEERERRELGWEEMGVPREGLYVREDCEVKCNVVLTGFIKKTVKKSHGKLVESLRVKAEKYGKDRRDSQDKPETWRKYNQQQTGQPQQQHHEAVHGNQQTSDDYWRQQTYPAHGHHQHSKSHDPSLQMYRSQSFEQPEALSPKRQQFAELA